MDVRVNEAVFLRGADRPNGRWARYCAYACVAIWGMGQLVPFDAWYLHGVTLGDAIFLGLVAFSVARHAEFRTQLLATVKLHEPYVVFVLGMMLSMLLAIWLNSDLYQVSPFFVLATLRSGYFLLIGMVILVWARQGYLLGLCRAYLVGLVAAEALLYFLTRYSSYWDATACSMPVLLYSNVSGNMLGIGIVLATLLVLEGRFVMAAVLSPLLAWESIYSFSKGAWGMVATGLIALFAALWYRRNLPLPKGGRAAVMSAVTLSAVVGLFAIYHKDLACFVEWKVAAQSANGSIETRAGMLEDVFATVVRYWAGVGLGRYGDMQGRVNKGDNRGFVGYSSRGNPHSAFLHILASGGIVAFSFFVAALLYPFYILRRCLPRSRWLDLYIFFAVATFIISGSFQLQLFSQHFFWIFAALLLAVADRATEKGLAPQLASIP